MHLYKTIFTFHYTFCLQGNYAVSGGLKGIEAVEAKAKSFKARMTV